MTTDPELLNRIARIEAQQEQAAIPTGINPQTGCPLPPIILAPDSFAGQKWKADCEKYQARRAQEQAEEERLRLEKEAEGQRAAEEWEAGRPAREAARRELALVRAELGALDKQLQPLRRKAAALKAIASGG